MYMDTPQIISPHQRAHSCAHRSAPGASLYILPGTYFCLKEVRAMVVAIKQPVAECSYYRTLPASLCSDNTQNLRRSTVERIPKQCPHQRSKVSVLTTHHGGILTP